MKLVPSYPYCDFDGTPNPGCEHQHQTTDPAELAVIKGIGETIIRAGIPQPIARAGEIVDTTWGCEKNTRMKTRKAFIYSVEVQLVRHPKSMFYRPQLSFYGWHVDKAGQAIRSMHGMVLTQFTCEKGEWNSSPGDSLWPAFVLESVSPNTGQIQRVPGRGVFVVNEKVAGKA
jgi:hypothetical protein